MHCKPGATKEQIAFAQQKAYRKAQAKIKLDDKMVTGIINRVANFPGLVMARKQHDKDGKLEKYGRLFVGDTLFVNYAKNAIAPAVPVPPVAPKIMETCKGNITVEHPANVDVTIEN